MNEESMFYAIRGKSDRRRKREAKQQEEKYFLSLHKEQKQLWNIRHNLGFEPLETPFQRGFKRFFVLREELHNEKQILFFTELLQYINTTDYSLRKDFKKRRRVKRKKVYVETIQKLKTFCKCEFEKIPEKFHPLFIPVEKYNPYSKVFQIKYTLAEAWRFKLKVEPNIITHRRKIDRELESEIEKLDNYIERNCLRHKLYRVKGIRNHWREWNSKNIFINEKENYLSENDDIIYTNKNGLQKI